MYDVIIIGGGVVGASALREAVSYGMKALLLEADDDVEIGRAHV